MEDEEEEIGDMENRAFSSIDFVGQCLFDPEKADLFKRAIEEVVRPEHIVLDVGTGSGILALLSAAAGAKKVYALEFDPFVAGIAARNFRNNNYDEKITTLVGDAREYVFDTGLHFDVVTMEMLSSGMVDEMQVQAINNLHRQGVVDANTIFLPRRQETFISLADVDFSLFGFDMTMILHDWKIFRDIKKTDLSEKALLNSVDFSHTTDEISDMAHKMQIVKPGTVNALWLSSRAYVTESEYLESTISINPPVAIPVAPLAVMSGDVVDVRVRYKFGHGYQNFSVNIGS